MEKEFFATLFVPLADFIHFSTKFGRNDTLPPTGVLNWRNDWNFCEFSNGR
jgi:hypothetical protein